MWKFQVALTTLAMMTAYAADVRITDADQRFKIKYGTYPPHVERALQAKADRQKARTAKIFKSMDHDKDGRISESEWNKVGRSAHDFIDHDRDEDGFITRSEWQSGAGERSGS
jgi:EF hand